MFNLIQHGNYRVPYYRPYKIGKSCDPGAFGFHPKISTPEDDVPSCIDRDR